jgi:hypothetical protein
VLAGLGRGVRVGDGAGVGGGPDGVAVGAGVAVAVGRTGDGVGAGEDATAGGGPDLVGVGGGVGFPPNITIGSDCSPWATGVSVAVAVAAAMVGVGEVGDVEAEGACEAVGRLIVWDGLTTAMGVLIATEAAVIVVDVAVPAGSVHALSSSAAHTRRAIPSPDVRLRQA